MKKFNAKNVLIIVSLAVLCIVQLVKEVSYYLADSNIINHYDNMNPAIVLYIAIPFLLFTYIYDLIKKKRKLDKFDYIYFALVLGSIIVTLLSVNVNISLLGKPFRHEGLLSLNCYYLLFINWKVNGTSKNIQTFKNIFVIIAVINSIYALFQIYTPFSFILRYSLNQNMATGLCGNPNFFGSLIVTVLSIVTIDFLINKKDFYKNIIVIVLLFVSLINCQSTGPFLSYIIMFVFMILFLLKNKEINIKRLIILPLILGAVYGLIYFINNYNFDSEIKVSEDTQKICELCDLNETISTGGNGRITIWKNSIPIIEKYWLYGVGYDTFCLVYPNPKGNIYNFIENYNGSITAVKINNEIVDNAHNVYLHMLCSSGIIGLIPYLYLCLLTFIKGLKSKSRDVFIMLGGFIAYSVQAFANINVIQVAPIYFVIIGLILSIKE